jgi:hypothetical protein
MTQEEIEEIRRDLPPGFRLCAPTRRGKPRAPNSPQTYCYRVKPEKRFQIRKVRQVYRRVNQCRQCYLDSQVNYNAADPERHRARTADWARRNAEHIARLKRENRAREIADPARHQRRKDTQKAYARAHPEVRRKASKRYREKLKRMRKARLPVAPVKPYLEWMLRAARAQQEAERAEGVRFSDHRTHGGDNLMGYTRLAEWMGVDEATVRKLFNGAAQTVSQYAVDSLASRREAEFTLGEVVARAREWAVLTGDSWPFGYKLEHQDPRRPSADKTAS